jgi:AcrR family transcriptional regulator
MPSASPIPDGTERVSQRQWQRDETISSIERAALPELVRRGYESTTAEHLADAAGVSIRTLFRYFPSGKDDVIVAELRRSLDGLESAIRARPEGEGLVDALRAARTEWMAAAHTVDVGAATQLTSQIAAHQPALMARLLGERQMFAERLVPLFAARLADDPEPVLRARLLAHCYVAALVTGYLSSLAAPGSDPGELVERALAMVRPLFDAAGDSGRQAE